MQRARADAASETYPPAHSRRPPAINKHKFERNDVVDPNWMPKPAHHGTAKQNFVEQERQIVPKLGTVLY